MTADDGSAPAGGEDAAADGGAPGGDRGRENDGSRFDRLPATAADRVVEGRATRESVVGYFADRFGIPEATFEGFTFWEKGSGKVWALHAEVASPVAVEGLGMVVVRTRQEHWKPTTNAVQRFGRRASRNVIDLAPEEAARFVAGEDQDLEWDGDWGYLVAAHDLAGGREPIGVGLYLHGELRSQVPKGRQVQR